MTTTIYPYVIYASTDYCPNAERAGKTNADIARTLEIHRNTVRNVLKRKVFIEKQTRVKSSDVSRKNDWRQQKGQQGLACQPHITLHDPAASRHGPGEDFSTTPSQTVDFAAYLKNVGLGVIV